MEATCTESGLTAGKKCSVCGEILEAQTEVPALDHDYKAVENTAKEATCTEAGKEADRKCSRCDSLIEGAVIPATGHTQAVISAVEVTCTETGLTAGKKCSVCGEILEAQTEVPALGHDYKALENTAKAATCTEAGKEADWKCSRCGDVKTGKKLPALSHVWDNGTVTIKPTTSAAGVRTFTCTACGEKKTQPISILIPVTDPVLGDITTLDSKAKAFSENEDPAGSTFSILQLRSKKVKKTSVTIAWKAVPKAASYVVYGAPCGSKYGKLKDVTGTSFKQSGTAKGKYYKYFVSAYDKNGNILAISKTIHVATAGGKKGNTKSVKLNKKKATLKKGKSIKLKVTLKKGRWKVSKHRKVVYESDNPKVATVSKSGNCTIYAYAQNGVFAKCKITVK